MATAMGEIWRHSYRYKMGLKAKSTGLLVCIQEVQSWNPGLETNYNDRFVTAKFQVFAIA